mmetsp:Transcript_107559/g.332200  ORF Transcript_107559/g.332200 Transcript_107559/m.332200 type:complete len:193 (-) Transcript_107559:8-586(-)
MANGSEGAGGYDDLEVYRTLASDELQVEILPVPENRKRDRNEAALDEEPEVEASDDEDDNVHVLLCDQGPRGGTMSYYLSKQWERPALVDGDVLVDDAHAGAIVPVDSTLAIAGNRAEIISQDEGVEATLGKIQFQMDAGELADTPWRQAGANLQDHFNFGLDEKQWKEYLLKQIRIRLEARQRRKIGVAGS